MSAATLTVEMRVFSLIILFVLIIAVVIAVWKIAAWPGKIAARRGHPQADAIRWCGWLGLVTAVAWPIAMIWAHTRMRGEAR
jgi:hypothetical protein